jgi:hypothetical protein
LSNSRTHCFRVSGNGAPGVIAVVFMVSKEILC